MRYIADLHIHSKYSRATSPKMDLEHLNLWAKKKGIDIITVADFTHPEWFKEIKNKLLRVEEGLYKLKNSEAGIKTRFILTTEISCIYSKNGRVRRVHLLIFAPNLETAEKINKQLLARGAKLKSDGRPILGMDSKELLKIVLDVSPDCLLVPAHCWTPWFGIFGSESGFDSLEECFDEMTPNIYALETGLSSDPAMNWRLSSMDELTLISNSDAHSLDNLGREANVFEIEPKNLSYQEIIRIIKEKDKSKFLYTIEFFPEEGKYHFDGHRLCGIRFSPNQTKKNNYLCPVCKKPLTVGVMHRVDKLADREENFIPKNHIPFKNLVPLREIIAEGLDKKKGTKGVEIEYRSLIEKGKSEFNILLDLSFDELSSITLPKIAEGIKKVKKRDLKIEPGYDGIYGTVKVFNDQDREIGKQSILF
ncbi:MAG: DNA and RNA helicase [Parcubacteria group bacterium Athens1014_10]|nr:MAG: DNA and RNA helicase [Parcubacteria group bacterium Athens1014_10]TSD05905.1 MAG: DNA and RNA helicase [Parcubacteria group bacterium Athens0714_12]